MQNAAELLTLMMGQSVTLADVRTSCPTCGQGQTLEGTRMDLSDPMRPAHLCERGCGPILIVGLAMDATMPDRGHPAGSYSLRNPCDVLVRVANTDLDVLYPASANALD